MNKDSGKGEVLIHLAPESIIHISPESVIHIPGMIIHMPRNTQKGQERVSLFGEFGLVNQLGSAEYARPRKFRERVEAWLDLIRAMWPECPATLDKDGTGLWVDRANAILTGQN